MNTFQRIENLEGQVVVIVGGAGQVGYATATRLAAKRARIILLVRRDLSLTQEKLKDLPHASDLKHLAIQASVTDSSSLIEAAELVKAQAGRCDILVNAAGISRQIKPENLDDLSDQIFDEILTTNLRGVFATIRSFAPLLKVSGQGLIVNISSTAAMRASNSNIAYASAKAGLNLMTKSLAKSLAPQIRVIAITPGYLEKPTSGITKAPGFNEKQAALTPLKRIGMADDIASAVEACATTMRFATGTNFIIDGGRTI